VEREQFEDAEGGGSGGAGGGRERGHEGESCEWGERPASEGEGSREREAGAERAEGYGVDVGIGDGGDGGGSGGGGAGAAGESAAGEEGSAVSKRASGRRVRSQGGTGSRQREKKRKAWEAKKSAEELAAAEGAPATPGAGKGYGPE
jgi:hypothetical protein